MSDPSHAEELMKVFKYLRSLEGRSLKDVWKDMAEDLGGDPETLVRIAFRAGTHFAMILFWTQPEAFFEMANDTAILLNASEEDFEKAFKHVIMEKKYPARDVL